MAQGIDHHEVAIATTDRALLMDLQEQILQLKMSCQEHQLSQRGTAADLQDTVDAAVAQVEERLAMVPRLSQQWMSRLESTLRRIQALESGDAECAAYFNDQGLEAIRGEMAIMQSELERKVESTKQDLKLRLHAMCSPSNNGEVVDLLDGLEGWKQQVESHKIHIEAELDSLREDIEVDHEYLIQAVTQQVHSHLSANVQVSKSNTEVTRSRALPMGSDDQPLKDTIMDLVSEMEVFREDLLDLTGIDAKVDMLKEEMLELKNEVKEMQDRHAEITSEVRQQVHEELDVTLKEKQGEAEDQFRAKLTSDFDTRFAEIQRQLAIHDTKYQENLRSVAEERDAIYNDLKTHREDSSASQRSLALDFTTQLDDLRTQFSKQTKVLTETLSGLHDERKEYIEELRLLREEHKSELERTTSTFERELLELRDDVDTHKDALAQAQSKMRVMLREREQIRGELKHMKTAQFIGKPIQDVSLDLSPQRANRSNTSTLSRSLPTTPKRVALTDKPLAFSRKDSICRTVNQRLMIDSLASGKRVISQRHLGASPRHIDVSQHSSLDSPSTVSPFSMSGSSLDTPTASPHRRMSNPSSFRSVAMATAIIDTAEDDTRDEGTPQRVTKESEASEEDIAGVAYEDEVLAAASELEAPREGCAQS